MAMVDINIWADELGVIMPGLLQAAAKQAIGATLREFCAVSGAWIRRLDDILIVSGQDWYTLNPQSDAQVLYIQAVGYANADAEDGQITKWLTPLQEPRYNARVGTPTNTPWGFAGDPEIPGRFKLVPVVATASTETLIPFVVLGPMVPFDEKAPAHFQQVHFDVILEGAAAKLMSQQDKPYTNIVMARYYGQRFRAGMATARDMARKQFTSADTDFRFPSWTGRPHSGGY